MTIHSPKDLAGLRRIGHIVGEVLRLLAEQVVPGMTTGELDAIAARALAERGARPTPQKTYGFPGTLCISLNDEAVHGIPGLRTIEPGDVLKLDLTADLNGYVADAARTVLVPPVHPEAQRLADCARSAFEQGLAAARANQRINEIGRAVEREVRRQGFTVMRELQGHGVGRKIHEEPGVPNFFHPGMGQRLTRGLVITIEPIIALGEGRGVVAPDRWTIQTADGSLSAHYEETIVITDGAALVLTAA